MATHRQEIKQKEWQEKLNYAHSLDYEDQQYLNLQRKQYKELERLDSEYDFKNCDQDNDLQTQYMRIQEPEFAPYLGPNEDKFWEMES